MIKPSVACFFNGTESFPDHTPPEAVNCGELHFSMLALLKSYIVNGFLSVLLPETMQKPTTAPPLTKEGGSYFCNDIDDCGQVHFIQVALD